MNVIDKIQALKRLSENEAATPAEAANAAARVQEMMLKHKITEIELGGEGVEDVCWFKGEPLYSAKRESTWRIALAIGIAKVNGCCCMLGKLSNGTRRISLVGRASDVEVVRYLYVYLERTIDRLAKRHLSESFSDCHSAGPMVRGKSFRLGAVNMVTRRLKEQKAFVEKGAAEAGQSRALTIVDKREAEVETWINKNAARRTVDVNSGDAQAWSAGVDAARKIAITGALE
jgi:hypothetical protein